MSLRIIVATSLVMLLGTGCNGSDFAGDSGKKANKPKKDEPKEEDALPNDVDEGKKLGGKKKPDPNKPGDEPNLNDNGDQGTIKIPDTTDSANGKPDTTLSDLLNGLINTDSGIQLSNVPTNDVDLGSDQNFHIGDSQMEQSTCRDKLDNKTLEGVAFYFTFEVTKPDTTITVDILSVCGVDYGDSNPLAIVGPVSTPPQNIPVGAQNAQIKSQALPVGQYKLVATSKQHGTDRDDYIIGNVKVHADKPIKAGKVGTSQIETP